MTDYTLHCGDCRDVMPMLKTGSIDLVFTSPPYYNAMDYAQYESYQHYLEFVCTFVRQVRRVMSRDGFFVLNTSPVIVPRKNRNSESVRLPIPFDTFHIVQSNGFKYIDDIVWKKPDGASRRAVKFAHHRRPYAYKPFPITEYLFVFRRDDAPLIDTGIQKHSKDQIAQSLVLDGYERTNVWEISPESSNDHPAVFPIGLANRVITYYSYVNDVVFDPFLGSGTTGVAAIRKGRRFVGIEKDAAFFEIAQQRIQSEAQTVQPALLEVT